MIAGYRSDATSAWTWMPAGWCPVGYVVQYNASYSPYVATNIACNVPLTARYEAEISGEPPVKKRNAQRFTPPARPRWIRQTKRNQPRIRIRSRKVQLSCARGGLLRE
jgi:hypothetical protein